MTIQYGSSNTIFETERESYNYFQSWRGASLGMHILITIYEQVFGVIDFLLRLLKMPIKV